MVRREQQAGAFAVEPFADGGDFLWRRLLLGEKVVQPEHHERVGVGQNAFVNRQFESCLVDALKDGDGVAGHLSGELLEAESGAMK